MFDKTRLAVDQGRRIDGESPASTELRTTVLGGRVHARISSRRRAPSVSPGVRKCARDRGNVSGN